LRTLTIVYSVLGAFSEISDLFLATSSQSEGRLTGRQAYLWDVDVSEKFLPSLLTMASDYSECVGCEVQSYALPPLVYATILVPSPRPASYYHVALRSHATKLRKSSESLIADAMGLRNEDRSWPAYSRMVKVHALLIEITNRFTRDFHVNQPASSSKAVTATWL
jgi:hypothetical protein